MITLTNWSFIIIKQKKSKLIYSKTGCGWNCQTVWCENLTLVCVSVCPQPWAHTQQCSPSGSVHPVPGGEETHNIHSLWTPLLLGVHHRVVQHEGQLLRLLGVSRHWGATLWAVGAMEREATALSKWMWAGPYVARTVTLMRESGQISRNYFSDSCCLSRANKKKK